MRPARWLALGVAAVAGCVGSVNPIVDSASATFDARLVGTWADSASGEHAVVARAGSQYLIAYTDDQGQTVSLDGTLGRSGARFILDVRPTGQALGAYKDLVIRLHIPLVVEAGADRARMFTLDSDSLDRYLTREPGVVAHGRTRDGLVLTADTPGLARFFAAYLARPGALREPTTWVRQSP